MVPCRIVPLLLTLVLGLATADGADGATGCTMRGPHWTLYPAHSNTPLHGSSYLVIPTRVSCATAKNYVKRLFAKNTSWPYARSRTSSMTLKGGPKGYRCESSVESRRNRRAYAGRCIYPGTGPQDFREFHWAPDAR